MTKSGRMPVKDIERALASREIAFTYRFRVAGVGKFPLDLLRQERCFPARDIDTLIIADASLPPVLRQMRFSDKPLAVDLISIRAAKRWRPRAALWKSHGWPVIHAVK